MDNQVTQTKTLLQQVIMLMMMIMITILIGYTIFHLISISDPYIQEVLSLEGDVTRGHAIFEINCAACHGFNGDGNVGPSLKHIAHHKSQVSLIKQVVSGNTPPMPKFQPHPQDMADLLSYLETL